MSATIEALARPASLTQAAPRGDREAVKAYVRDRNTEAVLREALSDLLVSPEAVRRADLTATKRALQQEAAPHALILDVSDEANPLMVLEDLSQFVEPGVRVLVIGSEQGVEFYREVTRTLGVLEYVPKPLNRDTVARLFKPWITGREPADLAIHAGRIVTVTGVRGGVGATTVAVNLASYLGEATRRHTLLVDADLHGGTAALLASAEATDALRVALQHPDRVDDVFLQRGVRKVSDRLHVLSAEESLDSLPLIEPESGAELQAKLRRHYNYVIVDVPRYATAFNRALLDSAHQHVLVMDGSLASIRDALRFIKLPPSRAQSRPPIVVLNHAGQPGTLSRKQVLAGLGQNPEITIPHLPTVLGYASTIGKPASRRGGKFRDAIAHLSQEITVAAGGRQAASPRGLLARWFDR
ncbi:MAG TPA: AAA family ATPase [Acetobacteraceae bacterium]